MFLTSMIMGVKIRTMWMTPFYLFFGVLVIYTFQSQINLNKLKGLTATFIILFILSPFAYAYVSITETDKRTDYPGKEIARHIQTKWDNTFSNKIEIVFGNEWDAGNLSYHLKSKPKWTGGLWRGTKEVPENINEGIVVIGNYNTDMSKHKICTSSNTSTHIVTLQLKPFNHSVCMIGKK